MSAGRGEEERVLPDGEVYRRYLETQLRGSLNLDYRLSDVWSIAGSSSVSSIQVDEDWNFTHRAPDSTLYLVQDVSVSADARRFVSFFQAGPRARLRYRHGFPLDGGDHFDSARAPAGYSRALAERHKLEAPACGYTSLASRCPRSA